MGRPLLEKREKWRTPIFFGQRRKTNPRCTLPVKVAHPPVLKSVRENSVVPPGPESFLPLFPALKRWAKLDRPSGAAFSCAWFHRTVQKRALTHTLKRCATQNRGQNRVFPQPVKPCAA